MATWALPGAAARPHLRGRGGRRRPPPAAAARAAVGDGVSSSSSSFYELLGVAEGGSFEDIRRAYRLMARRYHPDVCPPEMAEEHTRRFIEVQEAYETLSDPLRRAAYDRDLARGLHLALRARGRLDEGLEERSEWKSRWQNQVMELKWRSSRKDAGEGASWAARMREQRAAAESPPE